MSNFNLPPGVSVFDEHINPSEPDMPLCDMVADCTNPVTHIGEKGYVYCAKHAPDRQGWERVRKMVPWELRLLSKGEQLPGYKRGRMPKGLI